MFVPMLYVTEPAAQLIAKESSTHSNTDTKEAQKAKTEETQDNNNDWDLYAIIKGSKGNGKGSGKGKGYWGML